MNEDLYKQMIDDYTKRNQILEKKLKRSEENRLHGQEVKDRALNFLKQLKDEIDQANIVIQNRNQELSILKEEAEELARVKSDFLANMSHEIRTPMNAIIGFTHLLQKSELNTKQESYINKIENAAHTMLQIINDILDFSKLDSGQLELELKVFNLEEVLDSLAAIIGMMAYQKGLDLVILQDPDIPFLLKGDPLRLTQVLLNLLDNAVKFTEKGEIFVHVSSLGKNQHEITLLFEVKDRGIGLTDEQKILINQAFAQVDSSTTRKYGGIGLGLFISKQLVELMSGTLEVESDFGNGSNFYFTAQFKIPRRRSSRSYTLPPELKKTRILIIEESSTGRDVLAAYCMGFGFQDVTSTDKVNAVNIIENEPRFDLIIISCRFSGIEGINMLRQIKKILKKEPLPKMIMLTSNMRESILFQAKKEGFDEVLLKPINQSMLFNVLVPLLLAKLVRQKKSLPDDNQSQSTWNIAGSRVLLAEDNRINQEMACEILALEGVEVTVVPNGLEALNFMKKQKDAYDLILMDLHMPVIDGYEAAMRIRSEIKDCNLPIIAVTADAMAGTRERVLQNGMQDYITKPFMADELYRTIYKWLIQTQEDSNPMDNQREVIINIDETADWIILFWNNGLDAITALKQLNGNLPLYFKILDKFMDYRDIMVEFEHVNDDNLADKIRIAHTMKGLAGSIGAFHLQKRFALLERLLKENHYKSSEFKNESEYAGKRIAKIVTIIEQTIQQERHLLENPRLIPVAADASLDSIKCLLNLLEENDSEARKLYEDMIPMLEQYIPSADLDKISCHIAEYDFDEASVLLKERFKVDAKYL